MEIISCNRQVRYLVVILAGYKLQESILSSVNTEFSVAALTNADQFKSAMKQILDVDVKSRLGV